MKQDNVTPSFLNYTLTTPESDWIDATLSRMTLEEKVGQMIVPFAFGDFLNRNSAAYKRLYRLITHYKVGGIALFKGTILNYASLINEMQKLADIPLLISADFERGMGMRLTDSVSFPYNMGIAATGDPEYAYKMGLAVSQEMKALGVHQNYAPVADINININNPVVNVRAYSEDKEVVARFCSAFIRACNEEKILSTAKHFPGHGNTDIDSHTELSPVYSGEEEYYERDFYPFRKAVEAGVSSIMTAHLDIPAITGKSGYPATVSEFVVKELIRNRLNFDGLITTDAMTMFGISSSYSVGEGTVRTVLAGTDQILLPPDEEVAINALLRSVRASVIPQESIDKSVRRILKAKIWTGAVANNKVDISTLIAKINRPETIALAREISSKALKVIMDDDLILPLDFSKKVSCITIADSQAADLEVSFQNELNNRVSLFRKFILDTKSSGDDYLKAMTIAENSDMLIIPLFIRIRAFQGTILYIPEQIEFVNRLTEKGIKFVLICFGNPYAITRFKDLKCCINTFGDATIVQEAAARFIARTPV
ncbi:MAG TPA: glycoside hydrolase family 3 N-terminal domain-containing protein [Ignavibacteriaceae bacterium]|nr:glycoside hydrolase family 3 N-terminal domain-containing protein [Ignavibacteriaceae bacterium]